MLIAETLKVAVGMLLRLVADCRGTDEAAIGICSGNICRLAIGSPQNLQTGLLKPVYRSLTYPPAYYRVDPMLFEQRSDTLSLMLKTFNVDNLFSLQSPIGNFKDLEDLGTSEMLIKHLADHWNGYSLVHGPSLQSRLDSVRPGISLSSIQDQTIADGKPAQEQGHGHRRQFPTHWCAAKQQVAAYC